MAEEFENREASSEDKGATRKRERALQEAQETQEVQEREDTHRSFLRNILGALAVICIVGGGTLWYRMGAGGERDEKIPSEAATAMTASAEQEEAPEAEASTAATVATAAAAEPVLADIPIDFKTLNETCPDAYAWIRIANTQIDYAVCQLAEGDQTFYLYHRPDKTEEFAGSIYSENYNKRDFSDPVTVLYGHDMSDGSMFQNLHLYEDRNFFDNNKEVLVYTPDKVLHYRIFAAYNTDDGHLLLNNDNFTDPEDFEDFEKDILEGDFYSGYVNEDAPLDRDSKILTLSTCNAYEDQRFLVQCLLIESEDGEYKTEE